VRERAIQALRGKVSAHALMVDAALAPSRSAKPGQGKGQAVGFESPVPWPEPVDGAALLLELAAVLNHYVALPVHADVAVALWSIHAHALDAADTTPLLALTSPTKRCGKTRTLAVLFSLVPRPLLTSNLTPAVVFRAIDAFSPTLLVDEADTFLAERAELHGVINSGHSRAAAFVLRISGDDHEPRRFSTWGAKAVAMIGRLPDTLTDRSITIEMRRRTFDEQIGRLRLDRLDAFVELCRRAARWAADHLGELRAAEPDVPAGLSDRAADNWRPLLAIADLAGDDWPRRARQAALALSGVEDSQDGAREQLIGDIRDVFRERAVPRIFTEDILACLYARDDRPWREWRNGNPLTAIQLARLLKPFGIRPRSIRDGAGSAKGYELTAFADAFRRYLARDPSHPSQTKQGGLLRDSSTRHAIGTVPGRELGANPRGADVVTGVTAQNA
jgi:putative DNA primase/helicase